MPADDLDLFETDEPQDVELAAREPRNRRFALRLRWVVLAFAVLVAGGLTIGILVFNAYAPAPARGAVSAKAAASQFVTAINAGDGDAAAKISCDGFADDAHAAARSGADPDIRFLLVTVRMTDKDNAVAEMTERLKLPNTVKSQPYRLSLLRGAKRWLVCGQIG